MTETQLLTIASSLVAALFAALVAMIGWGGARIVSQLEAVVSRLDRVAGELHDKINQIDRRLTRVETKFEDHDK